MEEGAFFFPLGIRCSYWSSIKFKFAPRSSTLRDKTLHNKGNSVHKGAQTRDLLIKNERVLTIPSQLNSVN